MWPSHMTERGRRHGRRGARECRAALADGSTSNGWGAHHPAGHGRARGVADGGPLEQAAERNRAASTNGPARRAVSRVHAPSRSTQPLPALSCQYGVQCTRSTIGPGRRATRRTSVTPRRTRRAAPVASGSGSRTRNRRQWASRRPARGTRGRTPRSPPRGCPPRPSARQAARHTAPPRSAASARRRPRRAEGHKTAGSGAGRAGAPSRGRAGSGGRGTRTPSGRA